MLDLEETIISNLLGTPVDRVFVRPYAEEFLKRTKDIFDERYLNTCVPEEKANAILREDFDRELIDDFRYWDFKRYSISNKAKGYGEFNGSRIVHVEDRVFPGDPLYKPGLSQEEIDFIGHSVFFIPVRMYEPKRWVWEEPIMPKYDRELLRALKLIERNIRYL